MEEEAKHQLTVPPEFVGAFTAGVLEEIEFQARALKADDDVRDMRTGAILLDRDATLLGRLLASEGDAVTIVADADTLAHALHSMARLVALPGLGRALEIGPLDGEEVRPQLASINWAVDRAGEFYAKSHDEIAAQKVGGETPD